MRFCAEDAAMSPRAKLARGLRRHRGWHRDSDSERGPSRSFKLVLRDSRHPRVPATRRVTGARESRRSDSEDPKGPGPWPPGQPEAVGLRPRVHWGQSSGMIADPHGAHALPATVPLTGRPPAHRRSLS